MAARHVAAPPFFFSSPFPPSSSPPSPSLLRMNAKSKPDTSISELGQLRVSNNGDTRKDISKIEVPRQKYIPVSKSDLVEGIISMFRSQGLAEGPTISHFLILSSCLDLILHAEHKNILEEMRADYSFMHSTTRLKDEPESEHVKENGVPVESYENDLVESDNQAPFFNGMDLMHLFGSSADSSQGNVEETPSVNEISSASRFQRSFMKLLYNAQFEELSVRDFMLTSALNNDYLLTLPIYVDWKKAAESNAVIFRRGYATEQQKGLLIVEKLDYLQSRILQEIFGLISNPLQKLGGWISEVIRSAGKSKDMEAWMVKFQLWAKASTLFQQSYPFEGKSYDPTSKLNEESENDMPICLAAQKAVNRYEGFLSSIGPRGRLLRKFLTWIGFIAPMLEKPSAFGCDSVVASEPHLRPVFLSRISLSDIWQPATREYCGNNLWKRLKVAISIIFSRSVIQEPAFQELILLFTEDMTKKEISGKAVIPSLQLKIYEKIPIPDLLVVFPHKKLSFRILDTVRLDVATILGLLAYFINYKFENILSSPSAVLLDVIAFSALIIYVTRVALGYKQTRDRYQLLVNRTLNEKTLASGFGSVHFLLDASEQQQYKECILAYGILLKIESCQVTCRKTLGEECERFLYNVFKVKVEMPVNKAIDALIKFGLVTERPISGRPALKVVPYSHAYDALKKRWDSLF